MITPLSQLRNFAPSAPTLAISLTTSALLSIVLEKYFPSVQPQKKIDFSYLVTYIPLQLNSPLSPSQVVFNAFAAIISTNLVYSIAEIVKGFFKKPPLKT